MFNAVISTIERAIVAELNPDLKRVAKRAKELSLAFTSGRSELPSDYIDDHDSLAAYAAAFLLPNAAKVVHAIRQLHELGGIVQKQRLEILDLGAGPGTATLASALALKALSPRAELRFTAVDRSGTALGLAQRLFSRICANNHSLVTSTGFLSHKGLSWDGGEKKFDLIFAANVINEFATVDIAYAAILSLLTNNLCENGTLVLIDPALRNTARPLMALRNRLVAEGAACIEAPCLHHGPCPMLAANDRDWCHFYIDWNRPRLIEEIDLLANMDRRHLKMSYLVLRKLDVVRCTNHESRITNHGCCWRVVSSPLDSKGKREIWLCGANGKLLRVRRTNRDASELNADFDSVVRGDVVRCAEVDRIRKDGEFTIERRW